jgi:hypothetical protein
MAAGVTEALKTVSSGFKLVYIGLLLTVLAFVIGIVGVMIIAGGAAGGNVGGAVQMAFGLVILVSGLAITGKIIGLIGRFKCMAIPEQAGGARQMIVISVAMEVVSLILSVVLMISDLTDGFLGADARVVINAGSLILTLISAVLFLLFCRSAGEYVRRPDLAATAMSVLWLWVTVILVYLAAVAIAILGGAAAVRGGGANAAGGGVCVAGILMIAAFVIGIVALIRYANLLTGLATATLKYSRDAAYGFDDDDYDDGSARGRGRDDYDDEEDRPRKKRRPADEEEDDRPRRKKRRDEDDDDWDR